MSRISREEKVELKKRYHIYKISYNQLKENLKKCPENSFERQAIQEEINALGIDISEMRNALYNPHFLKEYLMQLTEKFFFGSESESMHRR